MMRVSPQRRRRELFRDPRGSLVAGGALLLLLMMWSPGASAFQPGASLLPIRSMGPRSIRLQGICVPGEFCPPSVLSSRISCDSILAEKGGGNGGGDAGIKRPRHGQFALEMSMDGGVRGGGGGGGGGGSRAGSGNDDDGIGARPSSPSSSTRRSFLQLLLGGASATALGGPLRSDAAPPRTVAWPPFAPSPGATVSKDGEPWPRDRAGARATAGQEGEAILRREVMNLVKEKPDAAPAFLRLAFHDAIARDTVTKDGGANGSILWELGRRENYGLRSAVEMLEPIKNKAGLSWADSIAVAGAAAITACGGPDIRVRLGRTDSLSPDPQDLSHPVGRCDEATVKGGGRDCRGLAEKTIPGAGLDSQGLRAFFGRLGFPDDEIVALMGGHTLGKFTTLIGVPKACLKGLNDKWEECLPYGDRVSFTADPYKFTNSYFKYLLLWNERKMTAGDAHFLPTDVVMVVDDRFKDSVQRFADNERLFFDSFARAYKRLVSIGTGIVN